LAMNIRQMYRYGRARLQTMLIVKQHDAGLNALENVLNT